MSNKKHENEFLKEIASKYEKQGGNKNIIGAKVVFKKGMGEDPKTEEQFKDEMKNLQEAINILTNKKWHKNREYSSSVFREYSRPGKVRTMSYGQKMLADAKDTLVFLRATHHDSRAAKIAASHKEDLDLINLLKSRYKQLNESLLKLENKNNNDMSVTEPKVESAGRMAKK